MIKITNILKILADKNRLRILQLIKGRKLCVCELAFVLDVTRPSISRHLKKMKVSGLVGQEQSGFWTDYYLKVDDASHKAILGSVLKLTSKILSSRRIWRA